ncbi:MAG: hypothetical protein NTV77_02740 [Candidatus Azambacteria bacterium]|nr:hypothetical protein [Candidatus Azambacteria bacterium]
MIDQLINLTGSLQSYVTNIGNSIWVADIKWLGGFLTLIFGSLIVFVIIKLQLIDKLFKTVGNFLLTNTFPKRRLNKSWQKILLRLNKNDEANLRLALIETDNIFDDLLKQMRLPGESMADRLKYLNSSQISNIDEIWQAHKLRNTIVHNPEYPITKNEIESSVRAYENALKELEFID